MQTYKQKSNKPNKFFRDLENAKIFELFFGEQLKMNGHTNISYNNDKKYDISSTSQEGIQYKFEIKCDANSLVYFRTGVEIMSWGKEAGPLTSEADFFIIFWPQFKCYAIIATDIILKMMAGSKYTIRTTGDKKATTMYLWDMDVFVKECQRIAKRDNLIFKTINNSSISNFITDDIFDFLTEKRAIYAETTDCRNRKRKNKKINSYYAGKI